MPRGQRTVVTCGASDTGMLVLLPTVRNCYEHLLCLLCGGWVQYVTVPAIHCLNARHDVSMLWNEQRRTYTGWVVRHFDGHYSAGHGCRLAALANGDVGGRQRYWTLLRSRNDAFSAYYAFAPACLAIPPRRVCLVFRHSYRLSLSRCSVSLIVTLRRTFLGFIVWVLA